MGQLKVLEVGFGTGHVSLELAKWGIGHIDSIDYNQECVQSANSRLRNESEKLKSVINLKH